jgi:hypothetical protein
MRTNEISEQLSDALAKEEQQRFAVVDKLKAELEELQKNFAEARKKIPVLEQRLSLKLVLRDKVLVEIQEIEQEIGIAEQVLARETHSVYSPIERTKRELYIAEVNAKNYINERVKELTQ